MSSPLPANRRVTAADIARSLGVSRATVGFVLNNTPGQTISEFTRERVLAEAARLGYRPHSAAQALASGRSRLILFVLPDWPMEYSLRRHIEEASHTLDQAGYALVTYTRHEGSQTRPLWETLNPDVVIGVGPFNDEDLASIRASGITRIIPNPDQTAAAADAPDVASGPALQVEHLHALGHRQLAFATAPDPRLHAIQQDRLQRARERVAQLGLPELDVRRTDQRDGSAEQAVRTWHTHGISGIIAYNDDVAATVVSAAVRAGLTVPGDLAVIGHDDTPLTTVFLPSLSSIRVDTIGLGRYVAELALHEAEGRPLPRITPDINATVIARESTGPAH